MTMRACIICGQPADARDLRMFRFLLGPRIVLWRHKDEGLCTRNGEKKAIDNAENPGIQ